MEEKDIITIAEKDNERKDEKEKDSFADKPKESPKSKKEKVPRGRRRLYADYQYKDVKNKRGKTVRRKVYTGKHYGFVIPKEYKKNENVFIRRIKLIYMAFFLIATAVWLLTSSVINAQGLGVSVNDISLNYFYVLLPYIVCALPIMLMFLTIAEFFLTKGNKHEQAFMEAISKNLRGQTVMLMVCAIITGLGEAVFMILNFNFIVSPFAEIGVILMMLALVGICIFWLRKQENFPMESK